MVTRLGIALKLVRSLHPGRCTPLAKHTFTAPLAFIARKVSLTSPLSFTSIHDIMPAFRGIPSDNDHLPDLSMRDATPMFKFEDDNSLYDTHPPHSDQLIFPLDMDDNQHFSPDLPIAWDSFDDSRSPHEQPYMSESPMSPPLQYFGLPQPSSQHDALFDTTGFVGASNMHSAEPQPQYDDNGFPYSQWLTEPESQCPPLDSSSSPIPIRSSISIPQTPPVFHSYVDHYSYPQDASFSPSDFAAMQPLPRSSSPPGFSQNSKSYPARLDDTQQQQQQSLQQPAWASQLWDAPSPGYSRSPASPRSGGLHASLSHTPYPIKRQSFEPRKRTSSFGQIFESASAPSPVHARAPTLARTYSRRAESTSVSDDRDATVRRKKRLTSPEVSRSIEPTSGSRKLRLMSLS